MQPLICPTSAAAAMAAAGVFVGGRAAAAIEQYTVGGFEVRVDYAAPAVEVSTTSAGVEVWKSPTNRTFISASRGLTNFSDSSGSFEITSSNVSARCTTAIISQTSQTAIDTVVLAGAFADPSCANWTWTLQFAPAPQDASILAFNASVHGAGVDNVYLAYHSPQEEAFFGLGEQASLGNLRGWRVPVWTREGGVGRGAEPVTEYLNGDASVAGGFAGGSALTSYTAVGSYVSSLGRFVVLEGTNYALVDLASNESTVPFTDTAAAQLAGNTSAGDRSAVLSETVEIMYEGASISGWAGRSTTGNALLSSIGSLTAITGKQPALPDWAHDGAILGIQGGQTKVEGIVRAALNASMPLVSVWLQDWSGTRLQAGAYNVSISRLWWNWEPDASLYPTWSAWVPHLQAAYGVRTMSYVNTFLANVSSKSSGYNQSFYAEAAAEGRFVLNATADDGGVWTITSGPGIDAGLLDISNETTVDWFKDLVRQQYYSVPISGMMQDFGEYLSVDSSVSISGGTVCARSFHNAYPGAWAALLRSVVEELGLANDTIGFHRSATTFSGKHTNLFWVGDQNIDSSREDGMRAAISSALHMGASGWAQSHSDIGGYTNTLATVGNITRSAALLGRWGEMGAFSGAAFRTHEGNMPQMNAQAYTNASTLAYHGYNARLYRSLKTYRKALLDEYQRKGWPMLRHPIAYAPNDTLARAVVDEVFWMGEALLVAPVYEVNAKRLVVYLPRIEVDSSGGKVDEGIKYKHLWTGALYEPGNTVVVDAPWGKPGVFVRWPVEEGEETLLEGLWDFAAKENGTALTA